MHSVVLLTFEKLETHLFKLLHAWLTLSPLLFLFSSLCLYHFFSLVPVLSLSLHPSLLFPSSLLPLSHPHSLLHSITFHLFVSKSPSPSPLTLFFTLFLSLSRQFLRLGRFLFYLYSTITSLLLISVCGNDYAKHHKTFYNLSNVA